MRCAFVVLENRCNLACEWCFYVQRGQTWTNGEMPADKARVLLAGLSSAGFDGVALTGGEPTLHPLLCDVIACAKALGMRVWLCTNGVRLGLRRALQLRKAGTDVVYLSGNALVSSCGWDGLERIVPMLREAGFQAVHITWVIDVADASVIRRLDRFGRANGVDIVFQPAWRRGANARAVIVEVAEALIDWAAYCGRNRYLRMMLLFYRQGTRPSACEMGDRQIVVDWNGDLLPCFHRRDGIVGNAFSQDVGSGIASLREWSKSNCSGAQCFGEHCISLFA